MACATWVMWSEAFAGYDFGPAHPMRPERVRLAMDAARKLGVQTAPGVEVVAPTGPASDALLGLAHDPDYIAAVRRASLPQAVPDPRYGLGTPDNPLFVGMHEVSALIAAASAEAAAAVWSGEVVHAVNLAGGLHHAMRRTASGFCIYNDAVVAIATLLAEGARRVAYVDVDVHHGDGVQAAFYGDPRVLTVSLHESGRTLFPGTGFPDESGEGAGAGFSANVALPAGTGDGGWLRAFDAVVPDLLRAFAPEVLVSQHGCDSHVLDPLANLELSLDGQLGAAEALHELAHEEPTGGRWLVLGGGGYDPHRVVAPSWSRLLALVAGLPPVAGTGAVPDFRRWPSGTDLVDPAIRATRVSVFPWHGLSPG